MIGSPFRVSIPKLIKAAVNFSKALPEQLLAQGYAVLKGLTGNANFTTLPVDLAYGPLGHTEWSDSATRMCI